MGVTPFREMLEQELLLFRDHDWGMTEGNLPLAPNLLMLVGHGRPEAALEALERAYEVLKRDESVEAEFAAIGIGVTGKTLEDRWNVVRVDHGKESTRTMRRWADRGRPRLINYLIHRHGGTTSASFECRLEREENSYSLSVQFQSQVMGDDPQPRGHFEVRVYPEQGESYVIPESELSNFTIKLNYMTRWIVDYRTDTWQQPDYRFSIRGSGVRSVSTDVSYTQMVVMLFVDGDTRRLT